MAKYIFDVSFDIHANDLNILAQGQVTIKSNVSIDRFDASTNPESEYSSARISVDGTDSHCQKVARDMEIVIAGTKYKSKSNEIVHCQS